jgi:hypothetical protein
MNSPRVEVFLEYRRVGERSTGQVFTKSNGLLQGPPASFVDLTFDAMLYTLARELEAHPEAEVFLLRTDRPGCLPYQLDATTVELLRTDPVAMVQAFTVPGSPSTLLKRRRELPPPVMRLRAGFDVLADAFGELVYVRG